MSLSTIHRIAALALAGWVVALSAAPVTYEIDPAHSSAQFAVRHMMVTNVRGSFNKVAGSAVYDPQNLAASKLEATVDISSVDTGNAKRDEHLRNADFFDASKFPVMQFKSKRFERKADGGLAIRGDLTMHGVTKEVVLDIDGPTAEVKDAWGATRVGASATTKINRKDFGLTWNKALEAGGVAVSDEVNVTLDIALVKKAPAKVSQR